MLEVMRHCPGMPIGHRQAFRDTTVAGYKIPKGTLIFHNNLRLYNDPKTFSQPELFKPERFLNDDGKFVGEKKFPHFLPFGGGTRKCPGESLGKINLASFIAVVLHRFKFKLPEGAAKPTLKIGNFRAAYPPKDYEVVAEPRF